MQEDVSDEIVEAEFQQLREAKKNNTLIYTPMVSVPPGMNPQHVMERLEFLARAVPEFIASTNPFRGEQQYMEMYQDMRAHPESWRRIFSLDQNCHLAKNAIPMLGALVTLNRQRQKTALAKEILTLQSEILDRFCEMREDVTPDHQEICGVLRYNFNRQKLLLLLEECRAKDDREGLQHAFPILRQLVYYEIDSKMEEQEFASLLPEITRQPGPPTKRMLNSMTESDWMFLVFMSGCLGAMSSDSQNKKMQLGKCGRCQTEEPYTGSFSKCGRCRVVKYCSKECQKTHWKTHKTNCVAKKKSSE